MATFKRDFNFNENIMFNISENIKKYRKIAGITQEQLAVDVGRSYDLSEDLNTKRVLLAVQLKHYIKYQLF